MDDMKPVLERLDALGRELESLKARLSSPRVQIDNLEGIFKTVSAAPSESDYRDGTVLLYASGTDRGIYAKINGAFHYAALT